MEFASTTPFLPFAPQNSGNNIRGRGGALHRNKQWVAGGHVAEDSIRSRSHTPNHDSLSPGPSGERWDRGKGRGRGRGRGRGEVHFGSRKFVRDMSKDGEQDQAGTLNENGKENIDVGVDTDVGGASGGRPEDEPFLETQEERDKFYQEASLVRAREVERRLAIATGKMDDPLVPKRLSDAITMVGTCPDMCPRFERYRRERENNLFIPWETYPPPNNTFPGSSTKRINHAKAVKMYERAAGDKTLPSDLRPPLVLRRTLDYLFHDLMMNEGFIETFNFVRDRTRSVRNDFTMQHEQGEEAMRCHASCARFHILALHFMTSNEAKEKGKGGEGFSVNLEEQQLMNTLQSLKEFYSDQRPHFQSSGPSTSYIFPAELEMRLYHRLVHIRDQVERHDDVPPQIQSHPLFALVSKFRKVVQRDSSEKEKISKRSKLVVSSEAMGVFGELVGVLQAQSAGLADVPGGVGGQGMIFLLACILEHLFGKDTIDEMESIRGGQRLCDIIDGVDSDGRDVDQEEEGEDYAEGEPDESKQEEYYDEFHEGEEEVYETDKFQPSEAGTTSAFGAGPSPIPISSVPSPVTQSAFSNLTVASANPFGTGAFGIGGPPSLSSSPFGGAMFGQPVSSNLPFQPSSSSSPFGRPAAQNEAPASRLPFVPPPPSSSSPFGQKAQSVQPTTSAFASPSAFLAPPPPAEKTKIFSSPLPFVLTPLVPPASNSGSMTMGTSAVGPPAPAFAPAVVKTSLADMPPLGSEPGLTSTRDTAFSLGSQPSEPLWGSFSIPPASKNVVTSPANAAASSIPTIPPISTTASTAGPSALSPSPSSTTRSKPPTPILTIPNSTLSLFPPSTSIFPTLKSATESEPLTPTGLGLGTVPPPAPRQQTISLPPSTPTGTPSGIFTAPSSSQIPTPTPSHPRLGLLKVGGFSSPGAGRSEEILSPLTPSLSRAGSLKSFGSFGSFSSLASMTRNGIELRMGFDADTSLPPTSPTKTLLGPSLSWKGKAREKSLYSEEEETLAEAEADKFRIRKLFLSWKTNAEKKLEERQRYEEAVERGDKYRLSGKRRRSSVSSSSTPAGSGNGLSLSSYLNGVSTTNGKQRHRPNDSGTLYANESMDVSLRSPVKKRRRYPRKSNGLSSSVNGLVLIAARTDDELAKRLKENQASHRLRWAPNTFLEVWRKHLRERGGKVAESVTALLESSSISTSSLPSSTLRLAPLGATYTLWLSMNPTADATAIWVQTKFGVEDSGWWHSLSSDAGATEAVFEIPLASVPASHSNPLTSPTPHSPGTIILETTPLGDDLDELERKYTILDDCARLRDILDEVKHRLEAQSEQDPLFFVPSLVMIHWADEGPSAAEHGLEKTEDVPKDLLEMVTRAVSSEYLSSYSVLSLNSKTRAEELDDKFRQALANLDGRMPQAEQKVGDLDVHGRLVEVIPGPALDGKRYTSQSIYKIFHPTFDLFVAEWLDNCASPSAKAYGHYGYLNYTLYTQLLQTVVEMVHRIKGLVGQLVMKPSSKAKSVTEVLLKNPSFPEFPASEIDDPDSLYETTLEWLGRIEDERRSPTSHAELLESMVFDLQSHRRMNKPFPTKILIEQLWELGRLDAEAALDIAHESPSLTLNLVPTASSSQPTYLLPTTLISSSLESFEDTVKQYQVTLSRSLNKYLSFAISRNKRRSFGSDVDGETESNTSSKRLRLSAGSISAPISAPSSVPASASTSVIDIDQNDDASIISVSRSGSQSPTTPTQAEVNGIGPRGDVTEEPEESTKVITAAMLKALTKNMKEKYRY